MLRLTALTALAGALLLGPAPARAADACDSLLADAPRRGGAGRILMLCETGARADALRDDRTVCRVAPRPGLSRIRRAG
ncbi:hypothetical protein [Methylobacterium mesophilicum]|uniref:hypothetical protein n=1 Tax=Methylobacterium mesophilicum TaxID=39956 RepID=UPI002F31EFDD